MEQLKKHLAEVNRRISEADPVIPAQRAMFKKGFSFSGMSFEEQLPIWHYIWKQATMFRPMLHAYLFLEQSVTKKHYHQLIWDTSVSWQDDVNDWPLCDALAKVNTKVLETYPAEVYAQLAAWNKSTDLWKRRQSVVSLLYYSRTKKTYLPFKKIVALVAPLLTDKEYYVQKGAGWTLREMYNVYPADTMLFLQQNIRKVSAIAFTIAIEKTTIAEKEALKMARKNK